MKTTIQILALIWSTAGPLISSGSEQYKPFVSKQYSRNDFEVSRGQFQNGNASISLTEAKRISKTYDEPPYTCRAWFEVKKGRESLYQQYFDDIDAVGFSYGLVVPIEQPPSPYFAVVKNGDYDGRLYLVNKEGKVFNLIGGYYFFSKDKKYLFSVYASDDIGLEVFDLMTGRVVFSSSSTPLPGWIEQWYEKDSRYFFTVENDSELSAEERMLYFYDFKANKIIEKANAFSEVTAAHPIVYDFDPRKYEDCKVISNKSIKRGEAQKKAAP